jgi:hypothetical protein
MNRVSPVANLVASVCYSVDHKVRDDLYKSQIVDERDYVSNLTSGIRKYWEINQIPTYVYSQNLPNPQENIFGCDALILVKLNDKFKLCLFEAKYPRFPSDPNYRWDAFQGKSNISHFSDQITRQSRWRHIAAIWELFMIESAPGKKFRGFDKWGSTCIWHEDALRYDHANKQPNELWNNIHLENLKVAVTKRFPNGRQMNLFEMLISVLSCKAGTPVSSEGDHLEISSADREISIRLPVGLQNIERSIPEFCQQYSVRHFWYFEIDDYTKSFAKQPEG